MTEEEKQAFAEDIINRAVEKAILLLPEVVTNLLQEKTAMRKLAKEFYDDNKDFNDHKTIVASVVEQIETNNPGRQYGEVFKEAVPIIRDRIKLVAETDLTTVHKPDNVIEVNTVDNGEL